MAQYFLCWNSYKNNICNGLSSLQQREEFVDMTLAADGHFVKVHQLIVSLASPYLKELIKSAPCAHPVVFLNKISYPILCSILEYIYTGQVVVNKDSLIELVEASKALHIKGLEDMTEHGFPKPQFEDSNLQVKVTQSNSSLVDRLHKYRSHSSKDESHIITVDSTAEKEHHEDDTISDPFTDCGDTFHDNDDGDDSMEQGLHNSKKKKRNHAKVVNFALSRSVKSPTVCESSETDSKTVQYTLSNQGSLQLVLNRFIYFLRYAHKNSDPPVRRWRCVDYIRNRCPASVTTQDDVVIQRTSAHKHAFHDQKIMKKMRAGAIFTAIKDAEMEGKQLLQKNLDKTLSKESLSDKE